MGITPDRKPGPSLEEEIQLEDRTADGNPTIDGAIRYVNGDVVVKVASGVKSLTAGAGGGISDTQHRALDQLVHEVAETSFDELEYQNPNKKKRVIRHTVWASSSMSLKVRETLITYGTGELEKKPVQVINIQFDGSGVEIERITETLNYDSNKKLDSITRALT